MGNASRSSTPRAPLGSSSNSQNRTRDEGSWFRRILARAGPTGCPGLSQVDVAHEPAVAALHDRDRHGAGAPVGAHEPHRVVLGVVGPRHQAAGNGGYLEPVVGQVSLHDHQALLQLVALHVLGSGSVLGAPQLTHHDQIGVVHRLHERLHDALGIADTGGRMARASASAGPEREQDRGCDNVSRNLRRRE
jgi:hypothetical protein